MTQETTQEWVDSLTEATRTRAAALLRAGAEVIERDGWQQGDYWPEAGGGDEDVLPPRAVGDPVCLVGGIVAAAGGALYGAGAGEPGEVAILAVAAHLGCDRYGIAEWNDKPGRRVDEVLAVLRAVADQLDPVFAARRAEKVLDPGSPSWRWAGVCGRTVAENAVFIAFDAEGREVQPFWVSTADVVAAFAARQERIQAVGRGSGKSSGAAVAAAHLELGEQR